MNKIATLQGRNVYRNRSTFNEKVFFTADADIDCDGSGGNPDGDKYFQPDTTLHHLGKALDAYKVPFIVVPPIICRETDGIVLGCMAQITYIPSGLRCLCVVGDIGPYFKVGEISPEAARRVGISPNPNYGGEDNMDFVLYEIFPGTPANVDGITYELKKL